MAQTREMHDLQVGERRFRVTHNLLRRCLQQLCVRGERSVGFRELARLLHPERLHPVGARPDGSKALRCDPRPLGGGHQIRPVHRVLSAAAATRTNTRGFRLGPLVARKVKWFGPATAQSRVTFDIPIEGNPILPVLGLTVPLVSSGWIECSMAKPAASCADGRVPAPLGSCCWLGGKSHLRPGGDAQIGERAIGSRVDRSRRHSQRNRSDSSDPEQGATPGRSRKASMI